MFTIFDCASLGNPKKWSAPASDTFNWPRLLHLAWQSYDDNYQLIEEQSHLVKPAGFELDFESEDKHHLTHTELIESGQDLKQVLEWFVPVINDSSYIISHNLKYNEGVLGAEYIRKSVNHRLFETEKYCLMMECTYLCKLPKRGGGYKWPTLMKLHQKCFGEKFEKMQNALADVQATGRCYTFLMQNGHLDLF